MAAHRTNGDDREEATFDRRYRAIVERYDDAPHQCTIFPADADKSERTTAWITAREPTFVNLNEWR